jgi:hypothetical protein
MRSAGAKAEVANAPDDNARNRECTAASTEPSTQGSHAKAQSSA